MFFRSSQRGPVARSYVSKGRIGELFKMHDGQAYVRTPYGFVKIDGSAAASISLRFAVLHAVITLLGLTTLAASFVAVVK